MMRRVWLLGVCVMVIAVWARPQPGAASAELAGCPMLPADHVWNTPVIGLPVHPQSTAYINTIGATTGLKADFGSGLWQGSPIGIPYTTATTATPLVDVSFEYADESDPGPYRIPPNPPIEGGGDRHILVVDRDACLLYEVYRAYPQGDGSWTAGSGAIFNLRSHTLRPDTWTSADAAGLPILPGLVRYDEVAAGAIHHALRFTVELSQRAYVWPARHYAASSTDPARPPMGMRFRLKPSYDLSGFAPQVQVILKALKTYGMLVADNGSNWYLSGAPDERWNNDTLRQLATVKGSDFEAVDTSGMRIHPDSGQAKAPCAWLDFNATGTVDAADIQAVASRWPSRPVSQANTRYDLDNDGDIDIADIQQISLRWGRACAV